MGVQPIESRRYISRFKSYVTRLFGIRHLGIRMSLDMSRDQGFALVGLLCRSVPVNCQLGDLVFDIVPSNTCSRHRFAVLRAGSCRAMVWWFWTMLQPHRRPRLRHRPSTTCFRRVSDNVARGASCRYMSGNRQLGGLDGAPKHLPPSIFVDVRRGPLRR